MPRWENQPVQFISSRVIAKRRFRLQMIILREGTGASFKTDTSLAELSKSPQKALGLQKEP